jgi:hypothetical protein
MPTSPTVHEPSRGCNPSGRITSQHGVDTGRNGLQWVKVDNGGDLSDKVSCLLNTVIFGLCAVAFFYIVSALVDI